MVTMCPQVCVLIDPSMTLTEASASAAGDGSSAAPNADTPGEVDVKKLVQVGASTTGTASLGACHTPRHLSANLQHWGSHKALKASHVYVLEALETTLHVSNSLFPQLTPPLSHRPTGQARLAGPVMCVMAYMQVSIWVC